MNPPVAGKNVKIAAFKGMIDSTNVEESKLLFDEVIAKNPTSLFLIFDFSGLEYLNSRAIGCLVECFEAVQKGGGGIILASPVPNVRDVISVVGIDKFLTMYPTVQEAILALRGAPGAAAPIAVPAASPQPAVQTAPATAEQPVPPAAVVAPPSDAPPPRIILE